MLTCVFIDVYIDVTLPTYFLCVYNVSKCASILGIPSSRIPSRPPSPTKGQWKSSCSDIFRVQGTLPIIHIKKCERTMPILFLVWWAHDTLARKKNHWWHRHGKFLEILFSMHCKLPSASSDYPSCETEFYFRAIHHSTFPIPSSSICRNTSSHIKHHV
jgi:hypothetical protein